MAREVTQETFAAAWCDGGLVVDVREADEYAAGHVPGARLMPLRTAPAWARDGRPVAAGPV
ncbi:rhodanese-like domain-containing protein [Streptomyces sp. NBC_01450]|uniref:rhodanese-like domain-containing protein n=1 Tax=Streptomyces sp. NBC_01450 TaxID=2903871 RepID=UPI002E306835|nr:rhodanese-like domain-containing protein [Streptomyces sp. NBC_01450]